MDKKKKGLADTGEGDFILNESGTSVNVDHTEEKDKTENRDKYAGTVNDSDEPYIPPVADEQKDITD